MLKKLLASIRDQGEATSAEDAWRLVETARTAHTEAERALDLAKDAYRLSLLADDDKAAVAKRAEVERCEVMVDRAHAAIGLAEHKHDELAARAAEATRRRAYAEAETKIRAAAKALEEYPTHAIAIRAILKSVAEANRAMATANADLPEGAAPLAAAEVRVRGVSGVPERELSRTRLPDAWFYTGERAMWGQVLPQFVPGIRKTGPGTGVMEMRDPETKRVVEFPVEARPGGTRVTFMPEKPGIQPEALHTQIALPGLHAGDPDIWQPVGNLNWGYEIGQDGADVLAAVAAREAAPTRTLAEMRPDGAPGERIVPPATPVPAESAGQDAAG